MTLIISGNVHSSRYKKASMIISHLFSRPVRPYLSVDHGLEDTEKTLSLRIYYCLFGSLKN